MGSGSLRIDFLGLAKGVKYPTSRDRRFVGAKRLNTGPLTILFEDLTTLFMAALFPFKIWVLSRPALKARPHMVVSGCHLTESQRAMVGMRAKAFFEKKAGKMIKSGLWSPITDGDCMYMWPRLFH